MAENYSRVLSADRRARLCINQTISPKNMLLALLCFILGLPACTGFCSKKQTGILCYHRRLWETSSYPIFRIAAGRFTDKEGRLLKP
jgi:hypothetical protein